MRYLLLLILVATGYTADAQSDIRELGIQFRDLDNFSLLYKRGLANGDYRRLNFAVADLGFTVLDEVPLFQFNATVSVGKERRSELAPNVRFARGWQPGAVVGARLTDQLTVLTAGVRLSYLLGFQYHVSDRFYFGVEVLPSASVLVNFGDVTSFNFNAGIGSTGVGLTAVYRFLPEAAGENPDPR